MFSLVFLGTSEFAVPSLTALATDARFSIRAVITQPDRPVGRHAQLTEPPIKHIAKAYGFPLFQPEKIKFLQEDQAFQSLVKESIDLFVVISYGKILPQWFLDIPKHGCVNIHGSLLPRWRGASPIQAAIAAGDSISGVTIMKLDAEMDHGPILAIQEESILDHDTAGSLHDRLALIGARMLPDVLQDYLNGKISPSEQDHSLATPCKILTRDDGKIDWNMTSEEIERRIRAYTPWPGTWLDLHGKRLKILSARIATADAIHEFPLHGTPGERFRSHDRPFVVCGSNTILELTDVQPEGKKPMSGEDFLRGSAEWTEN